MVIVLLETHDGPLNTTVTQRDGERYRQGFAHLSDSSQRPQQET